MTTVNDLEARAIAGEPVSPAELAAAREQERIDQLAEQGRQDRAARDAADAQAELVAQTKRSAATKLAGGAGAAILPAYDRAVDALTALMKAATDWNDRVRDAGLAFSDAGVPVRSIGYADPEDLDRANYAVMDQGMRVSYVVAGGTEHLTQTPALWVQAAIHDLAKAAGPLEIPGGRDLEKLLGSNVPDLIRNRGSQR